MKAYYRNTLKNNLCIKHTATSIAGGGMFSNNHKLIAKNSNRSYKKRVRQYFKYNILRELNGRDY